MCAPEYEFLCVRKTNLKEFVSENPSIYLFEVDVTVTGVVVAVNSLNERESKGSNTVLLQNVPKMNTFLIFISFHKLNRMMARAVV